MSRSHHLIVLGESEWGGGFGHARWFRAVRGVELANDLPLRSYRWWDPIPGWWARVSALSSEWLQRGERSTDRGVDPAALACTADRFGFDVDPAADSARALEEPAAQPPDHDDGVARRQR